jgi:autotransporter adhesin
VNVASTDAVNGSQLYAVALNSGTLGTTTAAAIGGGATYAATTGITEPSYALNGSSVTYTNVVSGEQALASGGAGPVQYSTPGTPSNAVNLVGTGGAVTLGNVAAGVVAGGSSQAVNGGQLFGTATSVASALGGGSAVNPNGTVSAPAYQVGGTTYNNVGGAVAALQNNTQAQLQNLQNSTQASLQYLQNQVNQNYQKTNAGISGAIAGTGLRYDDRAGKISTAAGIAGYHGQVGFAAGVGVTSDDMRWRVNAAITLAPTSVGGTEVGGVGGVSYTWN